MYASVMQDIFYQQYKTSYPRVLGFTQLGRARLAGQGFGFSGLGFREVQGVQGSWYPSIFRVRSQP